MSIKLPKHLLLFALLSTPSALAQTACIKGGGYEMNFKGTCDKDNFLEAFKTIYEDALLKPAGCTNSIEEELAALLGATTGTLEDAIKKTCKAAQDSTQTITLHQVADKGERFVSDYYNGGTYWNTQTETLLHPSDGTTPAQVLKRDAADVDTYKDLADREVFVWPNELPQFNLDECKLKAAQCCWPQDRQANDNNGNCAKPYDTNCVDKDPGDNTDLCMVDLNYAPSNNFVKSTGFTLFPGDNNKGEGPIHCHGFAWGNDEMDVLARYKANNLFFVSMYDHMSQRGYVRNIPGAPMCGCLEKMPIVSRSDCTQTNVQESYEFFKNSASDGFTGTIKSTQVEFQACQAEKNNDLASYYQRLVNEDRITSSQQEVFKKYIVGNNECQNTINAYLQSRSYTTGFKPDSSRWTYFVGEGSLRDEENETTDALKVRAMFEAAPNKIIRRACLNCYNSHKDIYYKRLTALPENFDILNLMMNDWLNTDNVLNVDFELYSTYSDAVAGNQDARWTYCNYNDYGIGFPRDCGPTGYVPHQWNSYYRGGGHAKNHAFFVEASPDFVYEAKNIAVGKTIAQSSTGWSGDANRALDGNTVGIYNWNTVTHTQWNNPAYWIVWFGTNAEVNEVYFWNRIDCCRDRLSNVVVELLEGMNGGDVVATQTFSGNLPVMNKVDFGGKTGQSVKIYMPNKTGVMSLAEVQIFGSLDETQVIKNVATGGTVSQSSTAYGGAASRATDGNTNGNWGGRSTTHTHTSTNPWWKTKMANANSVQKVVIYNRYDCCWQRLANPIVSLNLNGALVKEIKYEGTVGRGASQEFDFEGAEGDEVMVRLEGTNRILSLAEVQIFS